MRARHRQWLVENVRPGEGDESALVQLVCLDDDDPGRPLDVLWDLELGAEVIEPEQRGLGPIDRLDPPPYFGAYLHTVRWNAVSAADATRFQAPFRAGIKHMAHQLTPLMKALELPRANLFIADDVGLGKTIEAGLVLSELILRQQADFVLIACPASICLQWRDEMRRRFGLHFEVLTRQLIAQRRHERGFGVNPWATHHRFIISQVWARLLSSAFGSSSIGAVLRYTASDSFETFPFPQPDPRAAILALEDTGQRLYETRAAYMLETQQGLTQTYNKLKDPTCTDAPILALRQLHEEMDRAVLAAYGWTDIEVPPFWPTIPEEQKALDLFQDQVIDRLFVLNAARANEERRLGTASQRRTSKAKAERVNSKVPPQRSGHPLLIIPPWAGWPPMRRSLGCTRAEARVP